MKIALGSDHRGFGLKEKLKVYLKNKNHAILDFGTDSDASVDYPDFSKKVGESVATGESKFGIVICGSGIGVSIAANKVKGIRAVNATNKDMAEMSRRHNNANVICFGSDFIDFDTALKYWEIFAATEFEGGERHERRINKINNI
ncbi:MAG: ribose 5-phosphate isomerase B [Ignavibacteriae bacterium]|nr:ribose 5-phosphate isomerase B [Ignavibacteriota bacterium]